MENYEDVVHDALNRMKAACDKGTGVRLSALELKCLSLTLIGELWNQPDPRDARNEE
jgi:hypothetical protein